MAASMRPKILTPAEAAFSPIVDGSKDLLIPASAPKSCGVNLYSPQNNRRAGLLTNPRNFKTRFVKFRPHLQMVPGKARITSIPMFAKSNVDFCRRQCLIRARPEIKIARAVATLVIFANLFWDRMRALLAPICKCGRNFTKRVFEIRGFGDADTLAYYFEAKYKFTPQLFGACAGISRSLDPSTMGEKAALRWGQDLGRIDAAIGYRFTSHTQLKLQYSFHMKQPARATTTTC